MRCSPHLLFPSLLLAAAASLPAQNTRGVTQAGSARSVPSRTDDTKRAMTVADYAKWRTIRDVAITDDGVWASYGYQQRRVDDTLFVKNLSTGAEQKIPRASRAQFSDDSKWIAYFVAEPVRPNDTQSADEPRNGPGKLELRNLANGAVTSWDNVQSFAFSKGSVAMMVRKARAGGAGGDAAGRGGAAAPAAGGRGGRGGAAAPVAAVGTDMIL